MSTKNVIFNFWCLANTKKEKEDEASGVPATFQIIYFIGWKSDPSKPLPEPKDPEMVSLKDYYKLHELGDIKKIS